LKSNAAIANDFPTLLQKRNRGLTILECLSVTMLLDRYEFDFAASKSKMEETK